MYNLKQILKQLQKRRRSKFFKGLCVGMVGKTRKNRCPLYNTIQLCSSVYFLAAYCVSSYKSFVFVLTYLWLKLALEATKPTISSVSMSSLSFSRASPSNGWSRYRSCDMKQDVM
jgi:hypothetical protein